MPARPQIRRRNLNYLLSFLTDNAQHGVILSGIVGCGKTSLIETLCQELQRRDFEIFRFEGDDSKFRTQVRESSRLILEEIQSRGYEKPFVYVDEIQKEPLVFDAVKLAFDKASALFIVSGSNPAFLRTMANDRLQRRAIMVPQFPFSLREIMTHENMIKGEEGADFFFELLTNKRPLSDYKAPMHKVHEGMQRIIERYLVIGGLPQAWLAPNEQAAMTAIRLVAERGITETYQTTVGVDDEIRLFLASRNSQEFTYKSLQQSLRSTKRLTVDKVLDHLLNHGYMVSRPGGLHPQPLSERCGSLSTHTAPIKQTYYPSQMTSVRINAAVFPKSFS